MASYHATDRSAPAAPIGTTLTTDHPAFAKPCSIYGGKREHLALNFGRTLCGKPIVRFEFPTHEPDPISTCNKCLAALRKQGTPRG